MAGVGFPGSSVVKNLPAIQETFNPWVGKIPWRRKWQRTPVFLPGKSHGQSSLAGYGLWGSELDTTEHACMHPDSNIRTKCRKRCASLWGLSCFHGS